MKTLAVAAVCVLLGMSSTAAQQAATGEAGGELGFFIGKWTEEGQSRAKPTDAFGKITGNESCAWMTGKYGEDASSWLIRVRLAISLSRLRS